MLGPGWWMGEDRHWHPPSESPLGAPLSGPTDQRSEHKRPARAFILAGIAAVVVLAGLAVGLAVGLSGGHTPSYEDGYTMGSQDVTFSPTPSVALSTPSFAAKTTAACSSLEHQLIPHGPYRKAWIDGCVAGVKDEATKLARSS